MDRRLTPATAQRAHVSLRGQIDRPQFVEGLQMQIAQPLVDLCAAPGGARDRQLLWGQDFCLIDQRQDQGFGFARRDGYCGWLPLAALCPAQPATHWVASPATHLYPEPRVQAPAIAPLYLGSRLRLQHVQGAWAAVEGGFVPAAHLRPLDSPLTDPVAVAEGLLGTPYLWGGNSRAGIDCSGLIQVALHACAIDCPGDSDLQRSLGHEVEGPPPPPGHSHRRGDLLFWRGHVAMAVDADRLIHANGHHMAVAHEPIRACIDRIAAQGGGPLVMIRRLAPIGAAP